MNRKQLLILAACMLSGIALLAALFAHSPVGNPIPRQPFSRNFDVPFTILKKSERELGVNSFYVAGATEHTVYLGNSTAPFYILQVSLPKLDTQVIRVKLKQDLIPNDFSRFKVAIDSPYFYISHGVMPGIFKGKLSERIAESFLSVTAPYFINAVPINPDLIALKSHSSGSDSNELAILKTDSPYFEFKPDVLVKQVDGVFCVDGKLLYDKTLKKMVYVYSYRNEYILTDTALHVLNRYHTMDTFSRAAISVAKVDSKNYSTLTSQPTLVNRESYVSGRLLFIQSPLLAQNDDVTDYFNASFFDIYDMAEGRYLYSFYIRHVDGHKPSSLIITSRYIIGIFNQQLVLFHHTMPTLPI